MTLEISTIQNKTLRQAAEMADSKGNSAYNGNLDSCEIANFINNGINEGCSVEDILEISEKVVGKDSPIIQQFFQKQEQKLNQQKQYEVKLQNVSELEAKVDSLNNVIKEKEKEKESIYPTNKLVFFKSPMVRISGVVGAALGLMLTNIAVTTTKLAPKLPKPVKIGATILGALAGAFAGGEAMVGIGRLNDFEMCRTIEKVPNYPDKDDYQGNVKYNKAREFDKDSIEPIKQQKRLLEHELNVKKAELGEKQ